MNNYTDFSSDKININLILLDESSSMNDDTENVISGMLKFKHKFDNFPESSSIVISMCRFSDAFTPGEFKKIQDMDTSYEAYGNTALNYAIIQAVDYLKSYVDLVEEMTKITPRVTFVVFSDGESWRDYASEKDAKRALDKANNLGWTTGYVAFGKEVSAEYGKRLGFMSVIDVDERETVGTFWAEELSKSFKEQSQRVNPLGEQFFSRAIKSTNSENYSSKSAQALEDDSWIDSI